MPRPRGTRSSTTPSAPTSRIWNPVQPSPATGIRTTRRRRSGVRRITDHVASASAVVATSIRSSSSSTSSSAGSGTSSTKIVRRGVACAAPASMSTPFMSRPKSSRPCRRRSRSSAISRPRRWTSPMTGSGGASSWVGRRRFPARTATAPHAAEMATSSSTRSSRATGDGLTAAHADAGTRSAIWFRVDRTTPRASCSASANRVMTWLTTSSCEQPQIESWAELSTTRRQASSRNRAGQASPWRAASGSA